MSKKETNTDLKEIIKSKIEENLEREKVRKDLTGHFLTKKIGTCIDADLVEPWTRFSTESGIAKSRILSCALRDFLVENMTTKGPSCDYVLDTREKAGRKGGLAKKAEGED